ncbi:ferredoxin [Elusimicrobium posterum]|uniref:4Fe-4S dicluster domain-containing protein n=1 Tax=Elusimicrobium posterum TaxID=3116653 RepID=UPI003C761417
MKRKIIKIDQDKCVGCGACANACHQGAIGMVNGKAKLLKEDHCDGLGNCLPGCPAGAISFEEKEITLKKQETTVMENTEKLSCGCPGTNSRSFDKKENIEEASYNSGAGSLPLHSELRQWPVQIKLAPVNAPYFDNAHLLIAADCTAYAYANFHKDFIKGKVTLIGCPKLDSTDYSDKLAEIIKHNEIKSVTVARMQVPCCAGIEEMVKQALIKSGKMIPWSVKIIGVEGELQSF